MANGIAYCTMVSDVAIDNGYAYEWMAGYFDDFGKQDKKRTQFLYVVLSFICPLAYNISLNLAQRYNIFMTMISISEEKCDKFD